MRFSTSALSMAIAMAYPHGTSAFISPVAFKTSPMSSNMMPSPCFQTKSFGTTTCNCMACVMRFNTKLCMSSEVVEDTVPEEVAVLDGVMSEDEAHNLERPARDSGLAKHKKDNKKDKIPIADLQKGTVLTGRVKTITPYGAFMDVGYQVDALLHVSRMSDSFTANPEEVVKVGEEYQVRVINVDTQKKQIAVTMRSEEAESRPASQQSRGEGQRQRGGGGGTRAPSGGAARDGYLLKLAEKGFDSGVFMEGEVVNTLDWGAFVKVNLAPLLGEEEGKKQEDMFAEGLVHISSMSKGRVDSVSSVLKVGDKIQVRIKNVEGAKLALSMIAEEDEGGRDSKSSSKGGSKGEDSAPWSNKSSSDEWKATLLELQETMPKFKNPPIIYKARK